MEFLSLSRRRSSARNVPIGEERGETDVFAGYDFEDLFPTYTLSSPVTFLTGNHVYKSDLTKSRLRLHQQEIWVLDKVKINVVVQFYPCFFICFNLGMVMYGDV